MANTVVINDDALKALIKAFKGNIPVARVGILGSPKTRTSDKLGAATTNAEVGAANEYGTSTTHARSFLRVPLNDKLGLYLSRVGMFSKSMIKEVIRTKKLTPYVQKVAMTAEEVVGDAFATGGFGKWEPWKPGYTNNTGQILVDTQQLRNSITSEVR